MMKYSRCEVSFYSERHDHQPSYTVVLRIAYMIIFTMYHTTNSPKRCSMYYGTCHTEYAIGFLFSNYTNYQWF